MPQSTHQKDLERTANKKCYFCNAPFQSHHKINELDGKKYHTSCFNRVKGDIVTKERYSSEPLQADMEKTPTERRLAGEKSDFELYCEQHPLQADMEMDWEKEFDQFTDQWKCHPAFKSFIRNQISLATKLAYKKCLEGKHWIFVQPHGLEEVDGKIVPREFKEVEFVKVDFIKALLEELK